jgi:hypothetical protein
MIKKFVLDFIKSTLYLCPILMILEFSTHIFEKSSNIIFNKNPSIWSLVFPCGRTDMTKLIIAFRNFENASKNAWKKITIEL